MNRHAKRWAAGMIIAMVLSLPWRAIAQVEGSAFRGTNAAMDNAFLGKTGIGTNAPGKQLHVVGDSRFEGALTVDGAILVPAGGDISQGVFTNGVGNQGIVASNLALRGAWISYDGSSQGIHVGANGSVGIGTTNPAAALDVSGGTALRGNVNLYGNRITNSGDGVVASDVATLNQVRNATNADYSATTNWTTTTFLSHANTNTFAQGITNRAVVQATNAAFTAGTNWVTAQNYAGVASAFVTPAQQNGYNGTAINSDAGVYWSVPYSDTDAGMAYSFVTPTSGWYEFVLARVTDSANTSKTLSLRVTISHFSLNSTWASICSASDWDVSIPNGQWATSFDWFGTYFWVWAGDIVEVNVYKNDTAGGASGGVRFIGGMLGRL